jgi:TRAP-type C4-dicarboxylate transport system permease small subunit
MSRFTRRSSECLEGIGVIGILAMFIVNLIDVVGAKLFLWPLPGAIEVIGFSQIVAITPAIAFGLILGRHIQVEFFIGKLPKQVQETLHSIVSLMGLGLFILILWQSYTYGQSLKKAGEIGSTSRIPFFPFAYFIAFCCIPVCLVFLMEFLNSFTKVVKK